MCDSRLKSTVQKLFYLLTENTQRILNTPLKTESLLCLCEGHPQTTTSHSYLCFFLQQIQLCDVSFHLALLTDEVLNIF